MILSSPHSFRATPIRYHDRGLTLIFGPEGQVSLIGLDGGIASQTLGVSPTFTASGTNVLTSGTPLLSSESTSTLSAPNLEATSASSIGTSSFIRTPTSASFASSLASSRVNASSTATDTDTGLPTVPTVDYPAPSPTTMSNPKDHGVGAPFYLAIVLASISFVGCVSALIAWWIRSRGRKHDLEMHDLWRPSDSVSDPGSHSADAFEKGGHADMQTESRPYYLPASIVRRSSSNLLAVPHAIPSMEEGTSHHAIPYTGLLAREYPSGRGNDLYLDPHQNMPSSQTTDPYSRPGAQRLQTGLSVQESTRTLGRLRVANRVPGDVTSGDEGGLNMPRLQSDGGPSASAATNTSGHNTAQVAANAMERSQFDRSERPVQHGNSPVDPPGPATLSWGGRMDTVAALRRTRRRSPGTTVKTYKNARYSGYWHPTPDEGPSDTMQQVPTPASQEESNKVPVRPPLDPLGWTNTLKSSFWQAVDAVTGNRSCDPESRTNSGGGSRFTPAPLRVASRHSPVSPTTSSSLPDKSVAIQESHQDSIHSSLTRTDGSDVPLISGDVTQRADSLIPKVSRLNRDLASTNRRHPYSATARTETGSVYSTDSAAARANLRKYGYGDPIPSSWSALGKTRDSQLDLRSTFLPLPRPISSPSPGPLSITPSQLTLESDLHSSSASMRTRTSMHSRSDIIGSDASTVRSGRATHTGSIVGTTTGSMYSMSRNGTTQSGHSTIGHGTEPLQPPSSTTSSMLSRKKGVATKRKRPRPLQRASSTASSMQSIESGLSIREAAVRRALLERRRKTKAMGSLKDREDDLDRSRDESGFPV